MVRLCGGPDAGRGFIYHLGFALVLRRILKTGVADESLARAGRLGQSEASFVGWRPHALLDEVKGGGFIARERHGIACPRSSGARLAHAGGP